jgi:ferredoxin
MSMTRKEFFRQGILSLGKTALDLADTLKDSSGPAATDQLLACQPLPEPDMDKVASPDNGCCLARSCGCFICIERCEIEAIAMVPGVGIKIDEARCTGCGTCEYVCPVVPRAVRLQPRRKETPSICRDTNLTKEE